MVKVAFIASVPFFAFLTPAFTIRTAPREGTIAKAQEFRGYLKADGE